MHTKRNDGWKHNLALQQIIMEGNQQGQNKFIK